MWRACMIVKYINERSLKYFKALFADIFNQKRKKINQSINQSTLFTLEFTV